uniref:tail fiber domain-containing protein n=1 Tax=Segetibacter koreensis TaxID=398037 RepID=UPI00037E5B32
ASISSGLYVGNNGIFGYNSSGSGVYGSGSTYGVYGTGVDYGVYGYTTGNYGVFGNAGTVGVYGNGGSYGISGNASSSSGYGMFGQGGSIGVYGSGSSFGLYGYSGVQTAIYGYTGGGGAGNPTGVYGNNDSYGYGVAGYCRYGSGIFGSGGTYAGYFAGNVYSGGSYLGSDRKLKQNITNLESAMDVINKLRPKVYEFRQDGNFKLMNLPQGTHFGLIAQDLEQVLPNLVKDTKFDTRMALPGMKIESNPAQTKAAATQASEIIDFKAVNYTELIPIIIKGMQELNVSKDKKINDLQNQINKQQLEIDELKTLLQSITKPGVNITPTSAFIKQNTPNPLTNSTVISYYTPNDTRNAQILISDMKGSVLRTFNISKGEGQINMNVGELTAGTYNYTLYVNSNKIDTKQLIIVK